MMYCLSHSPATRLVAQQSLQTDMQADTDEDVQSCSENLNCFQQHVGQCIADAVFMPAQCAKQHLR